jgi:hypothetical protein
MLSARLLQTYFAAKILVSRLVAIIGPAFRSLWRKSDMPGRHRVAASDMPRSSRAVPSHQRRAGEGDHARHPCPGRRPRPRPSKSSPWHSPLRLVALDLEVLGERARLQGHHPAQQDRPIGRRTNDRHRARQTVSIREALADKQLLGNALSCDSWKPWRTLLIVAMGEKLTNDERALFKTLTGREHEPLQRVDELARSGTSPHSVVFPSKCSLAAWASAFVT